MFWSTTTPFSYSVWNFELLIGGIIFGVHDVDTVDLSATSSAMASAMARFYAAIKARYQL